MPTILKSEVTNINKLGFWVILDFNSISKEYFISFSDYPEFLGQKLQDILEVKALSPEQFTWEKLDIDIETSALENPKKFPLHFSR